jgi:hypothetical protein
MLQTVLFKGSVLTFIFIGSERNEDMVEAVEEERRGNVYHGRGPGTDVACLPGRSEIPNGVGASALAVSRGDGTGSDRLCDLHAGGGGAQIPDESQTGQAAQPGWSKDAIYRAKKGERLNESCEDS